MTLPRPHQPMALPRFSCGKLSLRMASEVGVMAPPPLAWITRAMTSRTRLWDRLHSSEPMVKTATLPI